MLKCLDFARMVDTCWYYAIRVGGISCDDAMWGTIGLSFRLYLVKSLHRGYHLAASCLGHQIQAYAELSSWDLPTPSIYEEPTYPLQIHSEAIFNLCIGHRLGETKAKQEATNMLSLSSDLYLWKTYTCMNVQNSACGLPMAARSAYVRLHLPRPMSTSSWIFTSIYWEKTS